MADQPISNEERQKRGFREGLGIAMERAHIHESDPFIKTISRDSIFNPKNIRPVWNDENAYSLGGRIGHLTGALTKDLAFDGTRVPYWAMNHPLAMMSVAGRAAEEAAGFETDYKKAATELQEANSDKQGYSPTRDDMREHWKTQQGYRTGADPKALPHNLAKSIMPLLASGALIQASGNHNMLNPLEGGRTAGYQAVIPTLGDYTQTQNPVLEAVARYVFGRTGRVLPWEQFTEERPEIGPEDYASYKRHQFDGGLLDIGLIKGTTRNLEGEPEGTMMGFRVPLSAATTGLGALGGGIIGSHLAARGSQVVAGPDIKRLTREGPRRMAGSMAGAILGALAGNVGGKMTNAALIQPILNPEAVAAQAEWLQQQSAAGLI